MKIDSESGQVEKWCAGESEFVGEPVFCEKKKSCGKEDDGYLATFLIDGRKKETSVMFCPW